MKAIYKRELRAMFTNLIGPLMCGLILAVLFLYFIFNNLIAWSADLAVPMNATSVLALTFAVPFLTMRLFAEEQRQKTDQLLFTAPVSIPAVVLGKFFAVATFLAIPVLFACILPFILLPYGAVQFLYCYTTILAFYLYALMITAIGLFLSAMTSNQFAAGIMTFLVILLGVVLGSAYNSIGIAWLRTFLQAVFDFGTRISRMMSGLFDLTSLIYFVSVCVLFLYLTMQALYARRYSFTGSGRNAGTLSLLLCAFSVLLVVLLNILADHLPDRARSFDVTANRLYSISEESEEVLRELTDDYRIYYLNSETDSARDTNVERVLLSYAAQSDHIVLEYVNTVINPQFYMQFSDTALSADSVVIVNETNGRFQAIDYMQLVETQLNTSTFTQYVTGYDVEGQVTGALQMLAMEREEQLRALFIADHGEREYETSFTDRFSRAGLMLDEINLSTVTEIPADTAFVVINAPLIDFSASDAEKVLRYLAQGGNLLFVTDYEAAYELPELDRILSFYDVKSLRGLVIETDPDGYLYSADGGAPYYIFPLMYEDAVTDGIRDSRTGTVFAPYAQSLSYPEEEAGSDGISLTPLLVTSSGAFLKTDLTNETLSKTDADIEGTQTLGLKAVRTLDNGKTSTALIYTSFAMFTESADEQIARGMNTRLFANSLQALTPGDARLVTIPVKSFYNTLSMNANATMAWSITLILIVPLIWVMGLIIWLIRRKL